MPSRLRYHLRFQVIPSANVGRDAHALARFCRNHGIEEVALIVAAEEWNNGLLSRQEEDDWFTTVKTVKHVLEDSGIVSSLNMWATVLHSDRGRRFPKDRQFEPMVSPSGEASKAVASFADPAWRKYVCELYGRFATLGFRVIWIDDDFRYHNHGSMLQWGGGFESPMLDRFARKIGRKVSRQTVVKNILKPGLPHPWRAAWMETWRDCQLEVARGLARSVARNAPGKSRIGLMSSGPAMHSIEGRDWRELFRALSIEGRVAHRPHFASYTESPGRNEARSMMSLDVQMTLRPSSCEHAPEIETYPFTQWTKSDSLTWAQMALCMFYGADVLLLDLFPSSGNCADGQPEIGRMLDRSRPGLEWIASRITKQMHSRGVGIPWRQDAQQHVQTSSPRFEELNASSLGPGHLLLPFGIPVSARGGEVNAIFGSLAWAFEEREIRRMLRGGLLLDAVSAEILCKRGFGPQIGINVRKWLAREESNYAVEMVALPDAGVEVGHYFNHNVTDRLAVFEPRKGTRVWTTIITPDRTPVGPATMAFENDLGGRVFTFAVAEPACLPMDGHRQVLMRSVVSFLSRGKFASPTVTGGPWLLPIHLRQKRKHALVVFNGSPDAVRPTVHFPGKQATVTQATLLSPLSRPVSVRMKRTSEGARIVLESTRTLPYLSFLVVEYPGYIGAGR